MQQLPPNVIPDMILAARAAGNLARAMQDEARAATQLKSDKSYVTQADGNAEQLIRGLLKSYLDEGFAFLGEETGGDAKASDFAFIVDPIDGTTNYSIGDPNWMVSIGLTYKGKPVAGVTYQPALDKLYWAEEGKGAYLQHEGKEKRLDVRNSEPNAYVFDVMTVTANFQEEAAIKQALRSHVSQHTGGNHALRFRSTGCPTVPLSQMAENTRSGVICWPVKIWDVAAAAVIAREAGAAVELLPTRQENTYNLVAAAQPLIDAARDAFEASIGTERHFFSSDNDTDISARLREHGIRYGISVGRRQPMHIVHVDCIRELKEAGLHPVIVIGSSNAGRNPYFDPLNNPLNETQQRRQIAHAMDNAGISDYTVLTLPDLGSNEEWAIALRHLLKNHGIPAGQSVFHYRGKASDALQMGGAVKPLSAAQESLMRHGFSVWKSINTDPLLDNISATPFRTMDLQDAAAKPLLDQILTAPEFLQAESFTARAHNPDKKLLRDLPVTVLDLSLQRMQQELHITTRDILGGKPAISVDQLRDAIAQHVKSYREQPRPGANVTGSLKLQQPSPRVQHGG